MNSLALKSRSQLYSLRGQTGINMVDLMMWLVIAAILLAASIQGIGYYREAVIMYYLKSDALSAASNVKSAAAQSQGKIDQTIVDEGLTSSRWSENTTRAGTSHTASIYSIVAGNPEVSRSVVYCSSNGITVVFNVNLAAFTCEGQAVASEPINPGGGSGGDPQAGGDEGTDTSGGSQVITGKLAGWGYANNFQLGNGPLQETTAYGPFHNKTITKMSSNMESCALADNVLWCWTRVTPFKPVNKQLTAPLAGKTVTEISVGGRNTCVIADGDVYCWGFNDFGQLGSGSNDGYSATPQQVSKTGVLLGKTLKSVTTGLYHVCAVDTEGKVYCWGKNTDAALGNGNLVNSKVPVAVNTAGEFGTATISSLSLSPNSTCALDTIGRVYCWGFATATGTYTPAGPNYVYSPTRAANTGALVGKSISQIYTMMQGHCGLSDGVQYCWGENISTANNASSVRMSGLPAGAKVIDGADSCVLMDNGKAYCIYTGWQALYDYVPYRGVANVESVNSNPITDLSGICIISEGRPWCAAGSNGMNIVRVSVDVTTKIDKYPNPVDLSSGPLTGKKFSLVNGGSRHSCGVADEQMYCWGANDSGQLGDGTKTNAEWPVAVTGVSGTVTGIAIGTNFTCATTGATTSCWGANRYGQLGNGTSVDSTAPVSVGGGLAGKTVKKIEAGDAFACAIDTNDKAYCWGDGRYGQLGNGTRDGALSPIVISDSGSLAGKKVTDISLSSLTACVVADGSPYCWGANWDGQFEEVDYADVLSPLGVDFAGKTAASVHVTDQVFCVLASDKNAYCWGAGYRGELGTGNTNNVFVPEIVPLSGEVTTLAAGSSHLCALVNNNVSCWGYGWNGQLGNGGTTQSLSPTAVIDTANVFSGKSVKALIAGGDDTFVIYE